jgi:hypothetical protein
MRISILSFEDQNVKNTVLRVLHAVVNKNWLWYLSEL